MSKNIRTQIGKVVGKSLDAYHKRMKPTVDELKFKEQYQGRIIDCMVGEVDDNYIETPLTDENVVKLEHSKEGVIKIPQIKGKTILIDADGNETDTPGEGCKLVSVGEEEDNKLIILSKNEDNSLSHKTEILLDEPLRSLPDGTCDEIVGNKLIKRLIQLNLKGTENITAYKEGDDYFRVIIADKRLRGEWNINKTYCNKLLYNHYDAYWVLSECIALDSNGQLYICLPKNELSSCSIEGVREYLRNNNIQIIATLTEPIIEELPNGITLQGFDDTTMYIENSITPTVSYGYNALIPYKEELRTQKEEVETNTLDIEQNIIPYLMDMEFNLMLMEDN